jgi:hypothetical protein
MRSTQTCALLDASIVGCKDTQISCENDVSQSRKQYQCSDGQVRNAMRLALEDAVRATDAGDPHGPSARDVIAANLHRAGVADDTSSFVTDAAAFASVLDKYYDFRCLSAETAIQTAMAPRIRLSNCDASTVNLVNSLQQNSLCGFGAMEELLQPVVAPTPLVQPSVAPSSGVEAPFQGLQWSPMNAPAVALMVCLGFVVLAGVAMAIAAAAVIYSS